MTGNVNVQEWEQFSAYRKLIRAAKYQAWEEGRDAQLESQLTLLPEGTTILISQNPYLESK